MNDTALDNLQALPVFTQIRITGIRSFPIRPDSADVTGIDYSRIGQYGHTYYVQDSVIFQFCDDWKYLHVYTYEIVPAPERSISTWILCRDAIRNWYSPEDYV